MVDTALDLVAAGAGVGVGGGPGPGVGGVDHPQPSRLDGRGRGGDRGRRKLAAVGLALVHLVGADAGRAGQRRPGDHRLPAATTRRRDDPRDLWRDGEGGRGGDGRRAVAVVVGAPGEEHEGGQEGGDGEARAERSAVHGPERTQASPSARRWSRREIAVVTESEISDAAGDRRGGSVVDEDTELNGPAQTYARRVGQRLRAIRRQKRLSLQEVEAASDQEFKASVLGAYERGERVISVPRLQRLADFYSVPVDQLLPREGEAPAAASANDGGGEAADGGRSAPSTGSPRKITFDLSRFEAIEADAEVEMVHKYLSSIQVLRQDFNGRVLTIRHDDIRAIAGLFGTDADALVRRLDDLQLRLTPA